MNHRPVTLADIRDAAAVLAQAHAEMTLRAKMQEDDLRNAVEPIIRCHRAGLEAAAEERAQAEAALRRLVETSPSLFVSPRSVAVDGVRAGYKKEEDTLDWDDDQAVIGRIEDLYPDLAPAMVRTQKSLIIDALAGLDDTQRRKVGLRLVTGADKPYVTVGDTDTDKLLKAILAGALAGQDDKPRAKKGKAKAKAKAKEAATA